MTWGSSCPQCGREDCSWVNGIFCEGNLDLMRDEIDRLKAELKAAREDKREAFAIQAEREACAMIVEQKARGWPNYMSERMDLDHIAQAIRARKP